MAATDDNKYRKLKRDLLAVDTARASLHPCLQVTAIVVAVALALWCVYTQIIVVMISNRLDYYKYCVDASEHDVLPYRNESALLQPYVFAYGYWALDRTQREIRWSLHDVFHNYSVADISLRGPLTHASPYVAPVAVAMGIARNAGDTHYAGVRSVAGALVADLVERPYAYYVAFEDAQGFEMARDRLDKLCPTYV